MGTRRSLGAPPGRPAALPPLPQGGTSSSSCGRLGTARSPGPEHARSASKPKRWWRWVPLALDGGVPRAC